MVRNISILAVLLVVSLCIASCGQNGPEGTGTDLIIVVPDANDVEPGDVAGSDAAARDNVTAGDTFYLDLATSDVVTRDSAIPDIPGIDIAGYECATADDCPQSGRQCEYVTCHPTEFICVQSNSSKSGDACDEGYLCRKDGRCEGGVCVYHSVECRDCGDNVCFEIAENCKDCPDDCGECPAGELDCQDGLDEDLDGDTDCYDGDDCDADPRCGDWQCVDYSIEEFLVCGQSASVEPFGLAVYPDATACDLLVSDYSFVYQFDATASQKVTVKLTPKSAGDRFRVFVIEGMCNPAYCLGSGDNNKDVTFDAKRGWSYYLIVDATTDFPGEVTTELQCL